MAAAAAILGLSGDARAFEVNRTSSGLPVRWTESTVQYLVDPSLTSGIPSAASGATIATAGWSDAAGAPTLSTAPGNGTEQPGYDGHNVIFYLDDFAPAKSALAVTVLTFDATTGAMLDTDIVINSTHRFAVLPAGATNPGAVLVSTEGGAFGSNLATPFDLVHVRDTSDSSALMYLYSRPGDATARVPGTDDLDGIETLYAGGTEGAATSGCTHARRAPGQDASHGAVLLMLGALVWIGLRAGRTTRARAAFVAGASTLLVLSFVPSARSAAPSIPLGDARAHVSQTTTHVAGGLLKTTLTLTVTTCRVAACPEEVAVDVWGGSLGGITQQIGETPAPSQGDDVEIAFAEGQAAVVFAPR
jgi:hypothetical protein